MILNFKESYKKDYENVKTDKAFRNRLSEEMNAVSVPSVRGKIRFVAYAAAAVAAVAVGLHFITSAGEETGIIHEQAVTEASVSTVSGLFVKEKWYGDAKSDKEIWDKFRELMGGGDIESIYRGGTEQLGEADILSAAEAEELSKRLYSAVPCESTGLSGEISFCMAVFGDGKIIKFRISENGEVQLNGAELICRFD